MSASKYPRPKILALDLQSEDVELVREGGYTVLEGTFGEPRTVDRDPRSYCHVEPEARLPNYTEQEIIVADLARSEARKPVKTDAGPPPADDSVWASCESGVIDPRPRVMRLVQEHFDRIYAHGGVFIFLTDVRLDAGYVSARPQRGGGVYVQNKLPWDNWGCLSRLERMNVRTDYGVEMEPATTEVAQLFPLMRHLKDAQFRCVIEPPSYEDKYWATLATSKYGDPVAGVLGPTEEGEGWIILLPRIRRPGELVRELLDEVLPALAPRLFPHAEGKRWTRRPEYELPAVVELRAKIEQIELEGRERIRALEQRIEEERREGAYLHDLLTATGDDLVSAVIAALKALGFEDVRDVDAEPAVKDGEGEPAGKEEKRKREDIQIWDRSPTLLVEVKGIGGLPREADSLQVTKYLVPRMREWDRTDVQGLSIVNHQRNLPALDRERRNVFQADVLANAEQQGFGLLTTWDLFRLVRGFTAHGWEREDVHELFYAKGRIDPIPAHYHFVGVIDGFWEQAEAVGVRIEDGDIRIRDTLAYELPVDFIEEEVRSLQLDNNAVEEAGPGAHVGVRTALTKAQARNVTRVFAVRRGTG